MNLRKSDPDMVAHDVPINVDSVTISREHLPGQYESFLVTVGPVTRHFERLADALSYSQKVARALRVSK